MPKTAEENREYFRAYYQANKEKWEQRGPSRTPEENREYMRAYYEANKEKWPRRTTE
jgi:hypothetical protein